MAETLGGCERGELANLCHDVRRPRFRGEKRVTLVQTNEGRTCPRLRRRGGCTCNSWLWL